MSYRVSGPRWLHNGKEFQFLGTNVTGMEGDNGVVFGLWTNLTLQQYVAQIKAMGHNGVRLPFSRGLFKDRVSDPGAAGIWQGSVNEKTLSGLSPLQICDRFIDELEAQGIRYIFSSHYTELWKQGEKKEIPSLWYTKEYSEEEWINQQETLAARYKGRKGFVGFDIKNEPKDEANPKVRGDRASTWGDGNTETDFRLAARRAYKIIHSVNPDLLYFVEILGKHKHGQLKDLIANPPEIPFDQLVYSFHEYGKDVWQNHGEGFNDPTFPRNMPAIYMKHFGQFAKTHALYLGEIGTHYGKSAIYKDQPNPQDIAWADNCFQSLREMGIKHVSWWALGEDVSGYECGGLYVDGSWRDYRKDKNGLLMSLADPAIFAPMGEEKGDPVVVTPTIPPLDPIEPSDGLKFFKYDHLPDHLQAVSKPFAELAAKVLSESKDVREAEVAVRKLLEAKDAAVRAFL